MADIKSGVKYVLTNPFIGSSKALASTSLNDSVIVAASKSDSSQSWYFRETSTSGYYRLHTEQKGDFAALDVFNYNGKNTIDLHMYSVQENTGQFWHFNKQDDGSFKINNQFTGSDIYLDIAKDTLQPTLAAKDGPGQRWTLNQAGSIPTATSFASTATMTVSSVSSTTASPTSSEASTSGSKSLSGGVIGGVVAGSLVGVAAIAIVAFLLWKRGKDKNNYKAQQPPKMKQNPILRV